MDLVFTLEGAEVDALTSEKLTPEETIDSVIHRLIAPLVERGVSQKLNDLMKDYSSRSLSQRISILSTLESIRASLSESQ